jgi:hypothetical protein
MAKVRAGELFERVQFWRAVPLKDQQDQYEKWLNPIAAKVDQRQGREELVDWAIVTTDQVTLFTIRYTNAVDRNMLVEWPIDSGDKYKIESIDQIGRREGLEIRGELITGRY